MESASLKLPPSDIPILLSSSVVAYDTNVRLLDADKRLKFALESVDEWLKINPKQPLVLCDGSGFDFSNQMKTRFPSAKFECLNFENNREMLRRYGRGYGEGEIVRFALENSRLIREAGCFAKCTSKLWVENYSQCAEAWNNRLLCHGVFLDTFTPFRRTRLAYIDTRFYIATVDYYRKYFEYAHHRIGMRGGTLFSLEDCFLEIINEHRLQGILMRASPVICGVGGGTGRYYRTRPLRRIKDAFRIKLAKNNPAFRNFFA